MVGRSKSRSEVRYRTGKVVLRNHLRARLRSEGIMCASRDTSCRRYSAGEVSSPARECVLHATQGGEFICETVYPNRHHPMVLALQTKRGFLPLEAEEKGREAMHLPIHRRVALGLAVLC